MNRRTLLASALAAPLALVAHRAASKEEHAILLARSTEPLGFGPSPLGTPMEVSRQCDVVGTFEDAPAGEVYVATVWGPGRTGTPYYTGYYHNYDWSGGG